VPSLTNQTMHTTLITGIGGRLATLVAGALVSQPNTCVVGIGQTMPAVALEGVRLYECDMRGVSVLDLLRATAADTLLHLDYAEPDQLPGANDGRGAVFRAIDVLGAAATAGVERVVLRSSTLVYGANPDAPAFIGEDAPLVPSSLAGWLHDEAEIERVAREFAARPGAPRLTVMRCAPIVGGGVDTPFGRYLAAPRQPVMLGFDPRIQVLHGHDAAVALALAVLAPGLDGTLNVAAEPPLPLGKAIHLAGGRALPLPDFVLSAAERARGAQPVGVEVLAAAVAAPLDSLLGVVPFETSFLRYGCVADTRLAQQRIGWAPQHTAEATLCEVAASRRQ
jgi:UDP-glucose 4-epimerase